MRNTVSARAGRRTPASNVEYRIIHRRRRRTLGVGTRHRPLRCRWHGAGRWKASCRTSARSESTYRALRDAERRYRSLFDNAIEGIFRTSPDGRYLDANPAPARIYGFRFTAGADDRCSDIGVQLYVDPVAPSGIHRHHAAHMPRSAASSRRCAAATAASSGSPENARAVHDDSGRLVCYEGTVEDVTELREYKERIERQACLGRSHRTCQPLAAARTPAASREQAR